MRENALGQRQSGRHQKRRPINGVEAHDFFADQVQIGRPQGFAVNFLVVHGAHIGRERVEPHVEDVFLVAGHRNTPFDRRAADGKILQPSLHEGQHLIAARLGKNEVRLRFVKVQQAVLKRRETEIVVLFGHGLGGPSAIGARIAGLGVGDVELVGHAILAGVRSFVDVPVRQAPLEQILHHGRVGFARGPLEAVDVQSELRPLPAEFPRDDIREFLRRFPRRGGRALDLLPVLVRARREHRVVALHHFQTANGVGSDGGVGVPDMRRGVHVIDRRRQVVFHRFAFHSF